MESQFQNRLDDHDGRADHVDDRLIQDTALAIVQRSLCSDPVWKGEDTMSSHSNPVRFCRSCGTLITVRSKTGYCQPCAVSCIAGPRYWQALVADGNAICNAYATTSLGYENRKPS